MSVFKDKERLLSNAHSNETVLEGYLERDQLASELNKSARTIDRWHAMGVGPPRVLIGRKPYYKRASVLAWLERHERDPERERVQKGRSRGRRS